MLLYHLVTVLCLLLMAAELIVIAMQLRRKKGEERKAYINDFKIGKGFLIYFYAIPLFWLGRIYAGENIVGGFFSAIPHVVELVVLHYNVAPVQALMDASMLYTVTVYISFLLIAINAAFFALSIASQYLWNYYRRICFALSKKDKVFLFGNNEQNCLLYESSKGYARTVVDRAKHKETLDLYMKGVSYTQAYSFEKYIKGILKGVVRARGQFIVVINTGDEEKNIRLSRTFTEGLAKMEECARENCFGRLKVFVFGDSQYEAVYGDIVKDGYGCVHYVNKYQQIAIDYVEKYPFTQFMDERHFDYETSLLKEEATVNVFMIGFGKTNRQIFLTSVANNQFLQKSGDRVALKQANYYIFDKNPAQNNKNFNHNYYRYKNECTGTDYLPLPDDPAREEYFLLDVAAPDFYNNIREKAVQSSSSVNFVMVAFGSDLENIDMAQKLAAKRKEWGIENLVIFVKVRGDHQGEHLLEEANCYLIGQEAKVVYNLPKLLVDDLTTMAKRRNEVYELENAVTYSSEPLTEEKAQAIRQKAEENWYKNKSQAERESNLYCCLSLRSKLHMMGLDYCKKEEGDKPALSEEEYLQIYAKGDMPDRESIPVKVDGKCVVSYSLRFPPSRRKNMAMHEHYRWNSFMISQGTVPATRTQILTEKTLVNGEEKYTNGKNYELRRHGNLTTFEGLVEFRQMLAKRDGKTEEEKDVIKYDYQLLDDAHWLLDAVGCKIVKRD